MPDIFIRKKPFFTRGQMLRLANILDSAGQVFLGVTVLSPIIAGVDSVDLGMIGFGLISTFICWGFSMWLTKKGEGI